MGDSLKGFKQLSVVLLIGLGIWLIYSAWERREDKKPKEEDNGEIITKIIWSKMQSANSIKVAELSGDIQGVGEFQGTIFRSRQIAKFPFSVDYFVDIKKFYKGDVRWDGKTRKLYLDAPDVVPAKPNIDESRRFDVQTTGPYISREAGEQLAQRVSKNATANAAQGAKLQKNMEDARERGVVALSKIFAMPLAAAGYGDVTVVVTFPSERHSQNTDEWDKTRRIDEVLADRR